MFAHNHESSQPKPVTGVTLFAARLRWYLRALGGRHPLVRTVDRLEAFTVFGVVIAALIAIPMAMSAGSLIHESALQTAREQAASRHSVQAVVVAGIGVPTDLDTPAYVRAQWREGTQERTESVVSYATTKPGDHMTVWLDNTGKVVNAPLQAGDAELQSVVAAGAVWTTAVMIAVLGAFLIRRGLDRARDRAWEREIALLSHNDDGWANRHT